MTQNTLTPDLAQDLFCIHKVITRALYVSLIKGREFLNSGLPKSELLQGYSSFIHCLAEVLRSHHQAEDLIAFPAFMKFIPSAPYAKLSTDHYAIDKLLIPIPQAIIDLSGETPINGHIIIVDNLGKLSGIWEPHMLLEEHFFSRRAMNAAFSLEEQKHLSETTSKYSQEQATPPELVVPFVLYNLDLENREAMARNFTPMVLEQLVPKVWKDQWAPMKPFLLN